ncbi:MAG: alpha/beta hydrolase [Bacteroidota bacterium]|nr:alpha/beta hydrolase [Bacteroidota bacterium]
MKTKSYKRLIIAHYITALIVIILVTSSSCAFRRVTRNKDIPYMEYDSARSIPAQQLNIFSPRKPKDLKDVLIFIHGGSWKSGNKDLYNFLGNRMARKGILTVIISYPLNNVATYNEMAIASARAVKWMHNNIKDYGGDPEKIFVSGHSAGGHLAALIAIRNEYFDSVGIKSPLKGVILIDAAGLDMYGYLKEEQFQEGHYHLRTFTSKPAVWKEASPMYHVHPHMPPLLIFRGEKTYPSIIKSTERFVKAMKPYVPTPHYKVQKGKRHIPMILQFIWTWNPLYKEIIHFMEKNNGEPK